MFLIDRLLQTELLFRHFCTVNVLFTTKSEFFYKFYVLNTLPVMADVSNRSLCLTLSKAFARSKDIPMHCVSDLVVCFLL